ncbi:MAG: S53 family peptidase [Proteobacteria bacterium]|uniref:S53 family peptidase n=1 Tax=Rudaea sp. TaxID=2136325 RepID=UPI003220599D|nr:S53 family peptidase [Pseudomonadota bacterium]
MAISRRFSLFIGCLGITLLGAAPVTPDATAAARRHFSPQIEIGPKAQPLQAAAPDQSLFTCQVGLSSAVCYDPFQMRHAYGVDNLIAAGYNGAGRSIVIIDAFQSPSLQTDVNTFSANYGLPPSAAFLTQVAPDGLTPFDPTDANMVGWSGEITLDVEWAHAIAPGAHVVLVLAKSNSDDDLISALNYAIDNRLGDVVSMSFGENETCLDQATLDAWHSAFAAATRKSMTLFASSGDQGAAQQTCDGNSWVQVASQPATDPLVSAVGGTELHAANYCLSALGCNPATAPAAGTYQGEIAWNEFDSESTGGGYSVVYDAPPYQKATVHSKQRAVPDVAYNAAIYHGVLTVWQGHYYLFGGTSAGAPQWAAITAIADQVAGYPLGFLNSAFYQIARTKPNYGPSFHDITSGNNSVVETDAHDNPVAVSGYAAGVNWDAATGIGSPIDGGLVGRMIQFTSPGDGNAAIAYSAPHGNGQQGGNGKQHAH